MTTPVSELDVTAVAENGAGIARELDSNDPLARFRDEFYIPEFEGGPEVYFVGNSLGLQPRRTQEYLQQELESWRQRGVRGHFEGDYPWMPYHEFLTDEMAQLIGGKTSEVIMMNSLTTNLHLMMATFYRPEGTRNKILIEQHAFPSDHYATFSQIGLHQLDPAECLIEVPPSEGVEYITTDDVCTAINAAGDSLALVLLPGVQYYTGQVFEMSRIAEAAHQVGAIAGFDLAHAAGNIPMSLHSWEVDFAVWCSYKYLNSGPGSVAGCFIHEKHATNTRLPRMGGWWGHDKESRFKMENRFVPMPTAEGWQLSNPPILSLAAIRASLDVFKDAGGIGPLREKSKSLTGFFAKAIEAVLGDRVQVITPSNEDSRGCQLSLTVNLEGRSGRGIYEKLEATGVRTDWREPNVIRAAPVPLYNTFQEVWQFVSKLKDCLDS
ncbi:MAG: kynureninase [Planctomycetota bacterium]